MSGVKQDRGHREWGAKKMMPFDLLLEEIETLPSERQETLVEILHHRLHERRRQEIARHARESRELFYAGRLPRGTVDDLVRDLSKGNTP